MAGSLRCFQIKPHYSPVRANNWDEWLPLAAPFGMRARLRQPISGVDARPALPRLRCGMRFWWKAALALSHSGYERSCAFVSGCGGPPLTALFGTRPPLRQFACGVESASWELYHHFGLVLNLMESAPPTPSG